MSTEEQIVALEQGLAGVQRDFLVHLSENNRQIAALNRVIASQEMNGRDVDHNLTILLGVASEQGRDIKVVKDDLGVIKEQVAEVRRDVNEVKQSMEARFEQVLQQLAALAAKLGPEA